MHTQLFPVGRVGSSMKPWILTLFCLIHLCQCLPARESLALNVKVKDAEREALVFPVPKVASGKDQSSLPPLVLCYHGHGGNAQQAARSFGIHETWKESLVVYPQGIPTPGKLTDPEGKRNGWQSAPGDQGDRDLLFFDELIKALPKDHAFDPKNVFVMGHSNGGGFTYLLWAMRGKSLRAVAPCAAVAPLIIKQLTPKPCLHLAGTDDPLVRFAWQERMMKAVMEVNHCEAVGTPWAAGCLRYDPKVKQQGATMIQFIHEQGHRYPTEATSLIVRFFREQCLR